MATLPGVSVGLGLESAEFTTGIARAQRQMDGLAANVRRSSGLMRGAFQNVGFQVQDFAVQIASGTGALRAFTQQAPQLASAFGPAGVAIGTLVAVAGAAVPALLGLRDRTRDADQAAKDFAATQDALKAFLDNSTSSINDQAAAISRLTGAQRELGLEGLQLQLQQANAKIGEEGQKLRETLGELQSVLLQPGESEVIGRGPILEALAAISEAQAADDPAKLAASVSRLVREMDDPALIEFQERLVGSSATIQNLRADAEQLQKSIADVGKGGLVPTTKEMEKAAAATTKFAAETEKLTGAQERLAKAGAFLTRTSAGEQRFDRQAEQTAKVVEQMQAFARQQDRIGDEIGRQQQRDAERAADLAMEPMRAALADMQSTMAGFFESALSGSIATFSDMADAFRSIFIRGVANAMSTALFNPSMINALFAGTTQATAQPTGGAAGAAGFGSSFTGLGGSLAAFGIGTGIGLTTHQLAGGRDQTAGLIGSTAGAAVGAGIGTLIAPGIGTLIGASLGGAAGGGLASLFGGGDKRARFSGSGGLGGIGGGEIGRFLADVDQQLVNMLTARQEALVDAALRQSSVNVRAKDFDQNVQAFAASQRIGPAAQALGFNAGAITGGGKASAQQQVQNLQTALGVQDQIRRLVEPAFQVAGEDLTNQFEEITAQAKRFGVSLAGLSEAQQRAEQDLRRAQDAQLAALLDPFEALRSGLEAFQTELQFAGANPAEQFALAQAEFARIAAAAEGGSIPAIEQLDEAGRLFIQAADAFGASPAAGQAIAEVRSTIADVLGEVSSAQEKASDGIIDVIDRHRREEIDTLHELIDEVRKMARKLDRSAI